MATKMMNGALTLNTKKFGVKVAKVEAEEDIEEEEEQLALPAPAAEKIPA